MMDKELSPKVYVPILAACALVPMMMFSAGRAALSLVMLIGTIGLIAYLIKQRKNDQTFKDCFLRVVYLMGAATVALVVIGANVTPPTPEQLAVGTQASSQADSPVDCPAQQAAIREQQAKIDYVQAAVDADRTLQADAKLDWTLRNNKAAITLALGEYTRKCQTP